MKRAKIALLALFVLALVLTVGLRGVVNPQTIRVVDAKSASISYGESDTGSTVGYQENFTGWYVGYESPNVNSHIISNSEDLTIKGTFQPTNEFSSVAVFKTVNIALGSFPILSASLNSSSGVNYGLRFYSQYSNGTTYNVWWEGSPLDHRPAKGSESLRVNMQREAFLATGRNVSGITGLELYVEDPPFSPQVFQFTLSKLSFERDGIEPISEGQYHAIYFDLRNAPRNNASWYLDKINSGVTVQASRGSIFSIYFFDAPTIYASTTAAGLEFDSLTSYSQYTFYP